jgi:pimeloyl-ACP methyl ester carboxylesterase
MHAGVTAVTLVPGAAGLGSFWHPIARRLPQEWPRTVLDLPGFGPVPPVAGVESYDALVEHVARQMPGPSLLAGQSMGAYVCLKLALRHPQLVTHLVLSVAAAGVDMGAAGASDWRPRHREAHPESGSWIYGAPEDLTARLPGIRVPVLLIWASRDPLSPLAVADQLEAGLPRASRLVFDTDDHWVLRRFAAQAARAIERHASER